jgi:hypothetical protein
MRGIPLALLLLVSFSALATNLSGAWNTSFSLGNEFAASNTLSLRVSFGQWEIWSTSNFRGSEFVDQVFTVYGTLENLDFTVGMNFKPVPGANFSSFLTKEFAWSGGFAAFTLRLGNFSLGLTLIFGPEK